MFRPSRRSALPVLAAAGALLFAAAPAGASYTELPESYRSASISSAACDTPLQFDDSSLPSGATINSADLTVPITYRDVPISYENGWGWDLEAAEADASGDPTGSWYGGAWGGWGEFRRHIEISAIVQDWVDNGDNHGVFVCGDDVDLDPDAVIYVDYDA